MRDETETLTRWPFLRFIAVGALGGTALGMVGGLTGVMRMEYKAKPWEHGLMLAVNFGILGVIVGVILAALLNAISLALHSNKRKSITTPPEPPESTLQ